MRQIKEMRRTADSIKRHPTLPAPEHFMLGIAGVVVEVCLTSAATSRVLGKTRPEQTYAPYRFELS
jgi:hypothetical protein